MNLDNVVNIFLEFNNSNLIMLIFAGSVIYWFICGDSHRRKAVALFTVMALALYNDLFFSVCKKLGMYTEYYRFFWLLPVLPVCAMTVVELLSKMKNKWLRIPIIFALLIVLFVTGDNYLKIEEWKTPDNKYGVSEDVPEVSTVISNLKETENPVVAFDYELFIQYRQYDPSVQYAMTREEYLTLPWTKYETDDETMMQSNTIMRVLNLASQEDPVEFAQAMLDKNVDYIVIKSALGLDDYLASEGCIEIGRTTNYTVYRFDRTIFASGK